MAEKNDGKGAAQSGGQDPATQGDGSSAMDALVAKLAQAISAGARSDADEARSRERSAILARQAAEDRARLQGGDVEVVAITGFSIVEDDPNNPRVVRAGEDLLIPLYDLPAWSGRVRLKSLDADLDMPKRGVSIS